jgi:FkbM family methyltransferase
MGFLRTLRMIDKSPLDGPLKSKIRRTYLSTITLKRYDRGQRTASIAGWRVKFCTFPMLSMLFKEVFVGQEYFFRATNDKPFILDCGSNIGMATLYFKLLYPQAEIIAFEPDPQAFACLEENVRENRLTNVRTLQHAVAGQAGTIDFFYDESNPGSLHMSTMPERMSKSRRVVEAVRLSPYLDREVDFLKMDIEGAETEVLEEVAAAGRLRQICEMVIEYHHHIRPQTDDLSRVLRLLEDHGFGYHLESPAMRPWRREAFQDVMIYAYRK